MRVAQYLFRLSLIVVAIALGTRVALALPPTQHEMDFRYVPRDRLSLDCGQMCEGWVMADGVITDDTPRRFSEFIAERKIPAQTIYFNSTGGNFVAAAKLASIIRAYMFQTALGRIEAIRDTGDQQRRLARFRDYIGKGLATELDRNQYLLENQMIFEHAVCYDACVLAFLGGVSRSVYRGSSMGLNTEMSRKEGRRLRTEQDDRLTKDGLRDFVIRMGADAQLTDIASDSTHHLTYFLSSQELSDLRVTYDPMQSTQTDWLSKPYFRGSALVASEQVLPYAAKQPSKNTITIYCLWTRPKFYVFQLQSFSEVLQSMGDAEDKDGEMLTMKVNIGEFEIEREKIRFFYSHRDSEGSEVAAILVDKTSFERALEGSPPMEIKAEFPTAWGVKIDSQLKTEGIRAKLSGLSKACVK